MHWRKCWETKLKRELPVVKRREREVTGRCWEAQADCCGGCDNGDFDGGDNAQL